MDSILKLRWFVLIRSESDKWWDRWECRVVVQYIKTLSSNKTRDSRNVQAKEHVGEGEIWQLSPSDMIQCDPKHSTVTFHERLKHRSVSDVWWWQQYQIPHKIWLPLTITSSFISSSGTSHHITSHHMLEYQHVIVSYITELSGTCHYLCPCLCLYRYRQVPSAPHRISRLRSNKK